MSANELFDSSLEAFCDETQSQGGMRLTERFCDVSQFLFRTRVRLQFGRFSRSSLKLLLLHLVPAFVECDCLACAADPWDTDLPDAMTRKYMTLQVLHDAIDLRELLFQSIPIVDMAHLRIFRKSVTGARELIVVGDIHRNDQSARGIHSLATRAKVLGFRFRIEEDCFNCITEDGYPQKPKK